MANGEHRIFWGTQTQAASLFSPFVQIIKIQSIKGGIPVIIKRGMLVVCSVVIPLLAAWQIVRGVISDEMIQPADRQTVVDGVAMTDNMDSDGDGFSDEREGL
jgi:hypothetical protein